MKKYVAALATFVALFVSLKLAHVIDWSWLWITLPAGVAGLGFAVLKTAFALYAYLERRTVRGRYRKMGITEQDLANARKRDESTRQKHMRRAARVKTEPPAT